MPAAEILGDMLGPLPDNSLKLGANQRRYLKSVVIVCISQSSPFSLSSHPAAARLSSFLASAQKIREELKGSHPSAYLEMLLCQSCMENMFCFLLTDTYFVFPPAALSPGTGEFLHSLPVSSVRLLPLQLLPYAPYVREASVSGLQFYCLPVLTCFARLCPF